MVVCTCGRCLRVQMTLVLACDPFLGAPRMWTRTHKTLRCIPITCHLTSFSSLAFLDIKLNLFQKLFCFQCLLIASYCILCNFASVWFSIHWSSCMSNLLLSSPLACSLAWRQAVLRVALLSPPTPGCYIVDRQHCACSYFLFCPSYPFLLRFLAVFT